MRKILYAAAAALVAAALFTAATAPRQAFAQMVQVERYLFLIWQQLGGNASGLSASVSCTSGCTGGTFNNNADAVATSATNGQVAAWLYGWNGASFDRLQVDGSKNLKVVFGSAQTFNQSLGLTPTDRTITSASGASQQIAAANASRHSLTIVNTGNANCGVNPTGGTAAIGGAGTLTLAPLGSYTPRVPTVSAVTVICTAGQPIYADEN